MLEPLCHTCTHAHSHATLHHVAYLPDLSAACMRAHRYLHTLMPHLHHDIAHTLIHACLIIYTCRFSFVHIQLLAATRTHTDSHVSVPPLTLLYYYSETTHSCAAPPYLPAWMSGPLAYTSFPQTFAPSHRVQVLI